MTKVLLADLSPEIRQSDKMRSDGPRIVHVSADFPDAFSAEKTPVVRSLIDLTGDAFAHHVISINRRTPRLPNYLKRAPGVTACAFPHGQCVQYDAPPLGVFLATMLDRLGDWIADELARGPRPALIVGHKLTIEGIVAHRAAKRLGVPFAISIQGNTDTKILAARPDLAARFCDVFHGAQVVMPFAPWALAFTESRLGPRSGMTRMLPCPTELDEPLAPRPGDGGLITAFHLRHHKLKNLRGLAAALRRIPASQRPPLTIAGGGSEEDVGHCRKLVSGLADVEFTGHLGHEALSRRMNRASGFILPSRRESFGLVFIEALFAGLPIIYPAGAAVDGYFDGAPFAIAVDPRDPAHMAAAIERLMGEETELKAQLATWQASPEAARFTRGQIARVFAECLTVAAGGMA